MDKLGSLIPGSLKKGAADRTIRASMVAAALERAARDVVDAEDGAISVRSIKNGTANVSCGTSVLAEEVRLHELEIVRRTAEKVGEGTVRRIVATA